MQSPKFKKGDVIKHKNLHIILQIITYDIYSGSYVFEVLERFDNIVFLGKKHSIPAHHLDEVYELKDKSPNHPLTNIFK